MYFFIPILLHFLDFLYVSKENKKSLESQVLLSKIKNEKKEFIRLKGLFDK